MRTNLGLTVASVVVMLATSGVVDAQIVTITGNGYVAAMGGDPAKATPKGTYSTNVGGSWRVVVDYGILDKGVYTPDANIAKGGIALAWMTKNATNGTWSRIGGDDLASVPANLNARARLEQYNSVTDIWEQKDVAYYPIP